MCEPLAQDDLWGKILRGATHRPGPLVNLLGKSKVGDLDMAGLADQEVFGLQIPVDDVLRVQVLPGQDHLGGVKPGNVIVEPDDGRGIDKIK